MVDIVADTPPRKVRSKTPLGISLSQYAQRLVPGKSVLLEELRDTPGVKSKYQSVSRSTWTTEVVPGYRVVPSMANTHQVGNTFYGDLWLTLKKVD